MKKILLFLALLIFSIQYKVCGQTWKPLGVDEYYTPSVSYTAYTNIATAPDGTVYIAYNDDSHAEKISVKRFNGTHWVPVGPLGFTENGGAAFVNLAISHDGTPYVSYFPVGGSTATASVRKLS